MVNPFAYAADLIDPPADRRWAAQPKQALATKLSRTADELLFGGAAGGGKSEWLMRYMADQMERYPGNRGVLFRRVFPALNRTIVPRAKAILRDRAKWNGVEHTFTFPNGSVLELGSLPYADSVLDYQGAEYGVIAFEELTEFLLTQYEYLIGRLRSVIPGVRPHVVATTNPGGYGHKWVKRRFIKPKQDDLPAERTGTPPVPYEIWRPRGTSEQPAPGSRVYVKALLSDNPALTQADPGYRDRLRANSNRALRRAFEDGDWDAIDEVEGALWTSEDLDRGRVAAPYRSLRRVVAVDPSDGDEDGDAYGVSVASLGLDGVGYQEASYAWRMSPRKMAEATIALADAIGADALVVEKNHGSKWLVEVFRQVDPNWKVATVWASDKKRTRAEPVATLFEYDPYDSREFRARIVGWEQTELEDELTGTSFTSGEPSPDRLDAMVWAFTFLMLGRAEFKDLGRQDDQRLAGRR